jgi:hypothetical protein
MQEMKSAKISRPLNLHKWWTAKISGPLILQEGKSAKFAAR